MSARKILFQISGSIAAYKACALISKLVQEGFDVQTVCTAGALQFIGPATLEGLTGKPVLSDTFAAGRAMDHIELARASDLTLLCPASASTINKLAAGIGDDLLSTLFLAHGFGGRARAPYWIVPAMNPEMYLHPATQASLARLRTWGLRILEPAEGRMACGETGLGRLLEPEDLLTEICGHFSRPAVPSARVLITSGATREPVDAVRFLTNFSSGATGAAIADALRTTGHAVTYLHGAGAVLPRADCERIPFETVADLDRALRNALGERSFDAVVHAAAVGDFTVARIEGDSHDPAGASASLAKLSSDRELRLILAPTPKLVDAIRGYSRNPAVKLVAFKLTQGTDPAAEVAKLLAHSRADLVVHNRREEVSESRHHTEIYDRSGTALGVCETKAELGRWIAEWLRPPADAPRENQKEITP